MKHATAAILGTEVEFHILAKSSKDISRMIKVMVDIHCHTEEPKEIYCYELFYLKDEPRKGYEVFCQPIYKHYN